MGKTRGNGEGTVFSRIKNDKKIWVAEYKRKTVYAKTEKDVIKKLNALKKDLDENKFIEKSAINLKDLIEPYIIEEHRLNKVSDTTYRRKLETLKQICNHYIATMPIQKIKEKDIKDFFFSITHYSNSTISKIYGVLNNGFKKAIKKNIIKYNFLDDADEFSKPKSEKPTKKINGLKLNEQQLFIKILKNDNSIMYKTQMLLSMYTGMRMGEINALQLGNVDLVNNVIHIVKTITKDKNDKPIIGDTTKTENGFRNILINEEIKKILENHIKNEYISNIEQLLFFDNIKNKIITTSQVNSSFKRLCEKHQLSKGFGVNQHMLRHTFATRCIESGMPANVLQKIMGHAKVDTTLETYCDVFEAFELIHSNKTYNYFYENNLFSNKSENTIDISTIDINSLIEQLKNMYYDNNKNILEIYKIIKKATTK